jgi:SurA N-terminal domain
MARKIFQFATLVLLLTGCALSGEIIERIVAVVNGHPILQSDWDEALRYQAFVNNAPLERMGALQRRQVLDQLINQELLREQMKDSDFDRATPEEIADRVADIRKEHLADKNGAAWDADLGRYGLTPRILERHVRLEINLARMIDVRLRPNVHIDPSSIETYYREEFLPQLRQTGVKEAPLVAVSPKIEELLAQQRVNELLTTWLRDLRGQSEIHLKAESGTGITAQ